jgi:hypothetical protein
MLGYGAPGLASGVDFGMRLTRPTICLTAASGAAAEGFGAA